ncbi:hypothetical protein [Rosistilla oblonga]|uniref:hypothetical protein n=1 Tax=Rosistilla oblonga TaxID=2527990 RepID=UPI003A98833E
MHDPTDSEILDCLKRSGYLMESRLISSLSANGYFVDPNQMLLDPITGKSREIDIVAEFYAGNQTRNSKCCVKTHFVIEAINNLHPVVLLTQRPYSPNSGFEDYSRCWLTGPPEVSRFLAEIALSELKLPDDQVIYAQYCGITKKKGNGELMASHLDDIYSSLHKAVRFCSDSLMSQENLNLGSSDEYWRAFFWQPVLVLSGRLLVADVDSDGQQIVREVPSANLEFNYHEGDYQRSMIVQVATESSLLRVLQRTADIDHDIECKLSQRRTETNA